MHQPPLALRIAHRKRRRARLAKRLMAFAMPMLLGPIAVNVSPSKADANTLSHEMSSGHLREADFNYNLQSLYRQINPGPLGLRYDVFREAMVGYLNLRRTGALDSTRKLLTIIDFEQTSTQKRLFVLDLEARKVIFNTLVAHGQGSGEDIAEQFSNEHDSHMSSLGFFVTGDTYQGCHGLSLYLNGQDEGFNSNAYDRSVVMHGAPYVSEQFIRENGRLGRSHGCPALPPELTEPIIETLKNGTCLFLYSPKEAFSSKYLNAQLAVESFYAAGRNI
jgi:hypothetical protein